MFEVACLFSGSLKHLPGSLFLFFGENARSRSRPHEEWSRAMPRIHFKNTLTFADRLTKEVERFRQEAGTKPQGRERYHLLRKARLAETAAHIDQWISSPGLKSPE
jgi:hypothetical protein